MANNNKNTIYVITGGNRGLGLGLIKSLLIRANTTVIATVRNENGVSTLIEEASTVNKGLGTTLLITKLDFSTASSPVKVREAFKFDIDHIDVLINNAGGAPPMVPATETTAEDLRTAFEVNAIAPLVVFQALWPLLQKSSSSPKLVMITSSVGSIAEMEPVPGGAYGPSKAAQNWLTRALHLENKDSGLITIALHPGWVQTRAGQFVADQWGFTSGPPDTIESSVEGMLKIIDEASGETSGKFITQKGQVLQW